MSPQPPVEESVPVSTLPFRPPNPSMSSLFASTSPAPRSRQSSHSRRAPAVGASESDLFSASTYQTDSRSIKFSQLHDTRNLISRTFVPHIAVHASQDTDEIMREKGFVGGLRELLRPFGETISGKVTVRDSAGLGRTWEDFGVRFVGLRDGLGDPIEVSDGMNRGTDSLKEGQPPVNPAALRTGGNLTQIEHVVDRHLEFAETMEAAHDRDGEVSTAENDQRSALSPYYSLFMRRLLSGVPLSPHETFSHPVASVIAISSRNLTPIDTLRQLYDSSSRGDLRLPSWVHGEYLRYYVLVHDEDRDDPQRSVALFEAMKRHFGLHCHLLRLRSSQCLPTDDDSLGHQKCDWITAAEELAELRRLDRDNDMEDAVPCLFETDAASIRSFVRELVTQSVVPFMERCIATWNDQVASRRRGLSGRFMSLSKKWTAFGSSSRNATGIGAGGASDSSSNYDSVQGYYRADAPEAIMRRLADFAFMLRDWKLAHETYDMLRSDFNNDKAWKYHAGANEMTAFSALLGQNKTNAKTRSETVDQMLDTASYSYMTRCAAPYSAIRCLALGLELLTLRGGSATDDAARWGTRILESRILGTTGHALFSERIAQCYAARKGAGSEKWGSRSRKSSMWWVLAADAWLSQDRWSQAETCLDEADWRYRTRGLAGGALPFAEMEAFVLELRQVLRQTMMSSQAMPRVNGKVPEDAVTIEEQREPLDHRTHRKSLSGINGISFNAFEAGLVGQKHSMQDDSFQ
ncbi:MAG: hypothetical protein M1817_005278 [Caeruleum heppii]|nr:MAG: hypothetical protein M1817_005278 [Caeruleum heppii]